MMTKLMSIMMTNDTTTMITPLCVWLMLLVLIQTLSPLQTGAFRSDGASLGGRQHRRGGTSHLRTEVSHNQGSVLLLPGANPPKPYTVNPKPLNTKP